MNYQTHLINHPPAFSHYYCYHTRLTSKIHHPCLIVGNNRIILYRDLLVFTRI
jgi:hypothetical protein